MHHRPTPPAALLVAAAMALAGCAADRATINRPAASAASIAAHVEQARQAAGSDLQALLPLCQPAPATRPSQEESDKGLATLMKQPAPPAGRAFDNLYYVGARWVSAWALNTSAGVILIDALDDDNEAATIIEPGLRSMGLDPAQIKFIVVTHGHGDHYGGAGHLVRRHRASVVMSELDWTMTETKLEFATPLWSAPPLRDKARDKAVVDGDTITLGDTTVTLVLTPGHTLGTVSPVFDVKTGGQTHRALLWGGTSFNFGRDFARLDAYIASTQRLRTLAQQQGIDVLLSNHAGYDGALAKLDQLRAQPAPAANPFVIGNAAVLRALTVMGECAQATRDRFAMQPG